MKKLVLLVVTLLLSLPSFAGGLLTNTNQHAAFLRMLARGATLQVDGAFSNPAGTALMSDGFYLSLNGQSVYQTRVIDATFALFPEGTRHYKGTASAPLVPSFFFAYKKNQWALSGFFGLIGGGGKASFDTGLPQFDSQVMAGILSSTNGTVTPNLYNISSSVSGRQFIYGMQLGLAYNFNDHISGYIGGRMNYFSGNYTGYVSAMLNDTEVSLLDLQLDCDQTGWGITPIFGIDYKINKWVFGAKYEMRTLLNIENDTKENSDPNGALADFQDGVNTPNDIPGYLSVAASYEITKRLRASVEYHFYEDKHAGMANIPGTNRGKQHALKHGTNEILGGVEFDLTKELTISAGMQRTDYGLSDDYQSDTSFSCDSYSFGFGGALKLMRNMTLNAGYFWTNYSDYTKTVEASKDGGYNHTTLAGTNVYSRTNKVFGLAIDYKF